VTAPRILLLNVNTNPVVTERLATAARRVAAPATVVDATEPTWGVSSVEGPYDAYISVAAGLARMQELLARDAAQGSPSVPPWTGGPAAVPPAVPSPWDALIWGGFGDPGAEAFEQVLGVPAFDLATAAVRVAAGRRYMILTTVGSMRPLILSLLGAAGLDGGCVGVADLGASVTSTAALPEPGLVDALAALARHADADGAAECFVLGSAALAGLGGALEAVLSRPVIDGVEAAVRLAEAGVGSIDPARHVYPAVKPRPGWPPAAARE
jgi:allantoin racemase